MRKRVKKKSVRRLPLLIVSFLLLSFGITTYIVSYSEYVSKTSKESSGISGNVVYINDAEADWYYYTGQNYTYNESGTIPTTIDKDIYNSSNLVEVKVTYSSTDLTNNKKGFVSISEEQDTFVYYKVFPVDDNGTTDKSDDYISILLIENPFTDRPTDMGFNGWVTNYSGVTLSLHTDYYERYAKIPVSYSNNEPIPIDITFNASWTLASVAYVGGNLSWDDAFSELKLSGFAMLNNKRVIYEPYDMSGYYYRVTIANRASCRGYYNASGTLQGNNCTCRTANGCTYYDRIENENYNEEGVYYYLNNRNMSLLDHEDLDLVVLDTEYVDGFNDDINVASYFRVVSVLLGESIDGYYNASGDIQTGTCRTQSGCEYYELIQFYKEDGTEELMSLDSDYYYYVTRDTNIIVMNANLNNTWANDNVAPFTLTGIYNGTDYNPTWTVSGIYPKCYNDTGIENIRIASGQNNSNSNPPSGNTSRNLYANGHNLRVGRGLKRNANNTNFSSIVGGTNGAMGSSGNVAKYKVIVESGFYNSFSMGNGGRTSGHSTSYLEARAVYGNDYDRIRGVNTDLIVYYCASGAWGGNYYSSSNIGITFDLVVKSGSFGTSKLDNTTGIYVGGRYGGTHYTARRAKVEGGWIYNIIGGPLSATNRTGYNDIYIYMTGGEIDMVWGGAGQTTTYGNRIIQVTGGRVNYSVFGGSNGYDGSEGDGKVAGDAYVYIGGTAVIGNDTYVNNDTKLFGAEAGSVFGIGNGKSGSSTIGSSDNSNIIIADSAVIKNSVYGGGNFGATGISSSKNTVSTVIKIIGGTVEQNIYGGGNNNGTGSDSKTSLVTINMTGGNVRGNIYGGSNELGVTYGSVVVNILSGIVDGSVYGGGKGGYDSNTRIGTYVSQNVDVIIGSADVSGTPVIKNNVYGGSAYGTVNGTQNNNTLTSYGTNVVVNNGVIDGSVFGGGEGSDSNTPYVKGNVSVTINNGTITNVFGGNDTAGTPSGTINVYVNGGDIDNTYGGGNLAQVNTASVYLNNGNSTNIYGGGNEASITTSNVYLKGGTATNVYGGCNEANATTTNVRLEGSTIKENLFGGSNTSGAVTTSNVLIQSGLVNNIYGGNNLGGSTTNSTITINDGTITDVYGGGRLAPIATTVINLNGATIANVYGGGEEADASNSTTISQNGSIISGNIFGGSNKNGIVPSTVINCNDGSSDTIYGGNNLGGSTGVTEITINGCNVKTVYGGGKMAPTTETNVNLLSSTINDVYGGGESADVNSSTNIDLSGSIITGNLFGGSNTSGEVLETNINATGGSVNTIYGGNNLGGNTGTTEITIDGCSVSTVYGGGKKAPTAETNVNLLSSTINDVYGGGESADITSSTNIILSGSTITGNLFGGSNTSGNVLESNINATSGSVGTVYGGNNLGGSTTTANMTINGITVNNSIYGGGNQAPASVTNVDIINTQNKVSSIFSGGNAADVVSANLTITDGQAGSIYGGSNATGQVTSSVVNITGGTYDYVYGSNNQGGITIATNVEINGGSFKKIFGGGNVGDSGTTHVKITDAIVSEDVFGGGNQAKVNASVDVDISNSTINGSVYGGGNFGEVGGNTDIYVSNVNVGGSLYAGGNGVTAIVKGNTLLNVDGTTTVTNHIFGGGNAAATGTEETNNSTSVVNIAGATVGKNVYGGANTSVLYGVVLVNIGQDVVTNKNLIPGNIYIGGTVFGGGEANASGSEVYDFTFISVTTGITINIDGNNHSVFDIDGSIFGSGNASTTEGYSYITIKNYGTEDNYKENISIQRANRVTLDNSVIELSGATDRTNEYSEVLFTLSRIDDLRLINNSVLYLQTGANLLKKFESLAIVDGVEQEASVTISDNGDVTRNVNNKVFMFESKNLNIATDQKVTAYGEVSGMTFFGMYSHDRDGKVYTALYNTDFKTGDNITSSDMYYFNNGSYVLGLHHDGHDYEVDGFYTNYNDEDKTGFIKVDYIIPTPEDSNYYMWVVGEKVATYDISITASKYSTLGTYELPLVNFSSSNTSFSILGFNYNGLDSDVSLIDHNEIPRVARNREDANNVMSLVLKTNNSGWITRGSTTFYTDDRYYEGTIDYESENSTTAPSLLFYLYHSKNLSEEGSMGTATISVVAVTPIDDLNNKVERININVEMTRAVYATNDYEGTITAGKEYSMFAPSLVNITSKSSLTTYYALFAESETNFYKEGYHRVLSSTYNFPTNTKITMIDFLSGEKPEYFYYVVSEEDHNNLEEEYNLYGEVSYEFSKFIKMGSSSASNNYDDAYYNSLYYNSEYGYAEEEFIFIVDFSESGITEDVLNKSLVIELRNNEKQTMVSVIGVQYEALVYNLYVNKDAVIDVNGSLSSNNIYIGEPVTLNVTTDFIQSAINSNVILDTSYFDSKLGIMLTIYDSSGNIVNGTSLLGVTFTLNGVTYYPRVDGTTRINIAERVANVSSNIIINTKGSSLASGDYTLKIESFGSPDGIYYGLVSSASTTIDFKVNNTIYGLNVNIDESQLILDKKTGFTENDNNVLVFNIEYSSGLQNPNLRVSLARRDYNSIYTDIYHNVDLKDYVTNTLTTTSKSGYYLLANPPLSSMSWFMYMKPELVSGTYKIIFSLYDNDTYIGDVHKYIIIK